MIEEWLFSELPPNTTQEVIASGEWSTWIQSGVLLLSLGVIALTAWNYRTIPSPWRRLGMVGLRTALVATLLFLFYQPTLLRETIQRSRNTLILLVDESESMGLKAGDESRAKVLHTYLQDHKSTLDSWRIDMDLRVFGFGDSLADWNAIPLEVWETKGKASNLLEGLEKMSQEMGNRDLAGVIVLSDGASTGLLDERLANATGLDDETRRVLEGFDAPIHSISSLRSKEIKDVSIVEMKATPFAFHLNATEIGTRVRVTGYKSGTSVTVTLFEDEEPVSSQVIEVDEDEIEADLLFEVVPRRMGTRVYSIVSTPLPGEVYEENNEAHALVKVIRDRLRVLQICGHPSWDQRFLRNFLKQDPDVDLISFFILVNPKNAFAVSGQDTTLIPFPARELFVEELGGFDLVIFQDFNHGPFQTRQHLWRIRDFVREGGAFLMLGGARTFSEGGYFGTEITEILPIEIGPSTGSGETLNTEVFRPILAPAGHRHPVTRLVPDPIDNAALWKGIPRLEGLNRSVHVKPDATALLNHPTLTNDRGEPMPVVAVGEAGSGRVMTVMTDTSWRWGFSEELQGSTLYAPFIDNAIRWLIQDPELELIRVDVSDNAPIPGTATQLRARVFDTNYEPATNHPVEITVMRRSSHRSGGDESAYVLQESGRTDSEGAYSIQFTPKEKGIYDIRATARMGERKSIGNQVLVAREHRLEAQHMVPRNPYLTWIAEATGGTTLDAEGDLADLELRSPDLLSVTQRKEIPLWAGGDILLIAFALMGSEWWFRRKLGYL